MNPAWLLHDILRAVFGPRKTRREPLQLPDDRNYGGPDRRFDGWPNTTWKDPWS
jgi:hypothetical protein